MARDAGTRIDVLQKELSAAKAGGDLYAETETLLAIGRECLRVDDPGGAHMHFRLAEQVGGRSEETRALVHEALAGQARAAARRSRGPDAVALYEEAAEAAVKAQLPLEALYWRLHQVQVLLAAPREELRERATKVLEEVEGELAKCDLDESAFSYVMGPPHEHTRTLAKARGERGRLALLYGRTTEAEALFREAQELAEAASDDEGARAWRVCLAGVLGQHRAYGEAIALLERVASDALQDGDIRATAEAAIELGRLYHSAYRFSDAVERLRDLANAIDDTKAREAILRAAWHCAERSARWDAACDLGEMVVSALKRMPSPAQVIESATDLFERARTRRDGPLPPPPSPEGPTMVTHYVVDRCARSESSPPAARATELAEVAHLFCDLKLGLGAPPVAEWARLFGRGPVEPGFDHRVVTDAVRALIDTDRTWEAVELLQRYKGVGFALPTLSRLRWDPPSTRPARLYLEALAELESCCKELEGPAWIDTGPRVEAVRAAGEALREAGELLRREDPVLHAQLGGVVRADELVDAFPMYDPIAVFDFVVGPTSTVGYLLKRGGHGLVAHGVEIGTFAGEHAAELMDVFIRTGVGRDLAEPQYEGLTKIAKVLHDRMFCHLARTVARDLQAGQLVLIPDILTRCLPLHMARVCGKEIVVPGVDTSKSKYLCDALPIDYAPALQALAVTQYARRPRLIQRVAAFSDPGGDLPATRQTVRWMREWVPDGIAFDCYEGATATVGALTESLGEVDILVSATHGRFSPKAPADSHLELADGKWTIAALAKGKVGSSLIVLAACEVGSLAFTTDDRLALGLHGSLIAGGAACVLASMWPLEPVSAGYLVERFLLHASHGGYRPAAALFRAVRNLREWPAGEALARCRAYADAMEEDGSADAQPETWILLDNLGRWIAQAGATPFANPMFWGGFVIAGQGWTLPAGRIVGLPPDGMVEFEMADIMTEGLLRSGHFAKAREIAERNARHGDGRFRLRALLALVASLNGLERPWNRRTTGWHRDRALLQARLLAQAEQDEGALARIEVLSRAARRNDDVQA